MGSIQALRSEALALRAKEDTALQVSGYLGTVNKSLGTQIMGMIEQLQGVVNERTKAYNGLVAKINKSINGKGGAGDTAFAVGMKLLDAFIGVLNLLKGSFDVVSAIGTITSIISAAALWTSLDFTIEAAGYDYEKEVSQLGLTDTDIRDPAATDSGAVRLVDKRDALMPRYKPNDPRWTPRASSFMSGLGYTAGSATRGYIGTLRRL